jgi:hypothetical protein
MALRRRARVHVVFFYRILTVHRNAQRHCRFYGKCARRQVEGVMRAVNFLITASVFCSIFIGLTLMSAALTGAVYSHVALREPLTMN